MLACYSIKNELMSAVKESGFPIHFVPRDLHLFPEKLKRYLQDMIDSMENVDYILLPMGRCGNGTIGLLSEKASLVLPKCGDCIDLIISKDDAKAERPKYSFF
jgi:electron transfer flavoprotein alpha subunit